MMITDVNEAGASKIEFHLQREKLYVQLCGTFGLASVRLQQKLEDGTWCDIPGASYSDEAADAIELGGHMTDKRPLMVRSVTSGVSGATALKLQLR